jgi:hypothetical protein
MKREGIMPEFSPDVVEWVVNDSAEIGIKIGEQFFWFKGNDTDALKAEVEQLRILLRASRRLLKLAFEQIDELLNLEETKR